MAALLDLHPDGTHPVLSGIEEIEEAVLRMLGGPTMALESGDYATAVTALERVSRRLDAVKLKLVAAANKAGTAKDAGFTGPDAWLAKQTTVSRAEAARQVRLANELQTGHDATAEALDAGVVSPGHAEVIVHATGQLPDTVSEEQRQIVESTLVEQARRYSPDQLRRLARRAIEAVEPDQRVVDDHENDLVRSEEQAARDKCSLTLHDNGDGTTTGHFTVPALAASILAKVIDAMTAPRRMRIPARPERQEETSTPTPDRSFDWRHRRGLALAELLEHLPTDHLHPRTAATVVVTIDHTVLAGALKAAHLDTGETLSAGEARRLACGAAILPAVLGTRSVALDLGGATRLFSEHQRLGKDSSTPPVLPPGANAPTPGANSTTDNPGPSAARPTSPTPSRCATNTINGSTTPGSTTSPWSTAASGSADGREDRRGSGYEHR